MHAKSLIRPLIVASAALAVGFGLMPLLIYYAGVLSLGRYEGAGLARTYDSLYRGLAVGSWASWVVVLGPCGLFLLSKALTYGWRLGARAA